jgi:hypothetical protein
MDGCFCWYIVNFRYATFRPKNDNYHSLRRGNWPYQDVHVSGLVLISKTVLAETGSENT